MRELPYEFDLLYDVKMMYEVESIANGEPSCSDASPEDLVELFIAHKLEMPECLKQFVGKKKTGMSEMPETHVRGSLIIDNLPKLTSDCDFGIQIADDGRVWIYVNGVSFARFKPAFIWEK